MTGTNMSGNEASIRLSDVSVNGIARIVDRTEPIRVSEDPHFSGVSLVEVRREGARQMVSVIIVSTLLIIIVASFGILFMICLNTKPPPTTKDLREVLEVMLAPVIGIVGAVTGFYFGAGSAMRGETSGGANRPM